MLGNFRRCAAARRKLIRCHDPGGALINALALQERTQCVVSVPAAIALQTVIQPLFEPATLCEARRHRRAYLRGSVNTASSAVQPRSNRSSINCRDMPATSAHSKTG